MGGKVLKFAAGGAILGAGLWVTDQLWFSMVHPRLPDAFTNWVSMSRARADGYRYSVSALGAMVLVPFAAGLLGLGAKSPIKSEASPLKG